MTLLQVISGLPRLWSCCLATTGSLPCTRTFKSMFPPAIPALEQSPHAIRNTANSSRCQYHRDRGRASLVISSQTSRLPKVSTHYLFLWTDSQKWYTSPLAIRQRTPQSSQGFSRTISSAYMEFRTPLFQTVVRFSHPISGERSRRYWVYNLVYRLLFIPRLTAKQSE